MSKKLKFLTYFQLCYIYIFCRFLIIIINLFYKKNQRFLIFFQSLPPVVTLLLSQNCLVIWYISQKKNYFNFTISIPVFFQTLPSHVAHFPMNIQIFFYFSIFLPHHFFPKLPSCVVHFRMNIQMSV